MARTKTDQETLDLEKGTEVDILAAARAEAERIKAEALAEAEAIKSAATPKAESLEESVSYLAELVPFRAMRQAGKDDLFVSINGKNMIIKRGEQVMIPRSYAIVLQQSEQQDEYVTELIESEEAKWQDRISQL